MWYTCQQKGRKHERKIFESLSDNIWNSYHFSSRYTKWNNNDIQNFKGEIMKLLGKDGILYITLAIAIYLLMPLFIIIAIPFMWIYSKITGKEF